MTEIEPAKRRARAGRSRKEWVWRKKSAPQAREEDEAVTRFVLRFVRAELGPSELRRVVASDESSESPRFLASPHAPQWMIDARVDALAQVI
jgi:hypothetical protein